MKKLLLSAMLFLGASLMGWAEPDPEPELNYCEPEGVTSRSDRYLNSLTVTDNLGATKEITAGGSGTNRPIYVDQTSQVFVTSPGATITIRNSGDGVWMHNYVYVDFGRDGTFDVNEENCRGAKVDQDLVSHTGYTGLGGEDPTVNSDGSPVNYGTPYTGTLPSFTLPIDLAPGDYRVRHKIDWNCVDPCGQLPANNYSTNDMRENGGSIVDFIIRVESSYYDTERTVTVVANNIDYGVVEIIDPAVSVNEVTTAQKVVKVNATPNAGYVFVNWTIDGTEVSTEATYSYHGEESATLTANFEALEYCAPTPVPGYTGSNGNTSCRGESNRYVTSINVSDGDGTNTMSVEGTPTTTPRPVYYDRTGTIFTTEAGKTVNLTSVGGGGAWMNTFVYVDWDLNGLTASDRVFTNFSSSTGMPYNGVNVPISVPATQGPGKYRVRYIVDWQNNDPCFYGVANEDNGEIVIDFIIQIPSPEPEPEPEYKLNISTSGMGDVVVADEYTVSPIDDPKDENFSQFITTNNLVENGSVVGEKDLLVIFIPKQHLGDISSMGTSEINRKPIWDNSVGAKYDFVNTEDSFTVRVSCYYVIIPKEDITENINVTAVFGTEVQDIDGIGMEESNGPAEYYNLQGVRVAADNLVPGFYIVRQGGKATKVFIQK